jgi:hypothetical protein
MPFYIGAAKRLADADFARIARRHGIEEAALRAVNAVEARSSGFYSSGAVVCLYEPHIAYRLTSGAMRGRLVKAGIAYQKWGTHPYPASSFPRIDRCAEIAGAEIAAQATSWGLGQIMGFNHKAAGHDTAFGMVEAFAESEANQLEGMACFIKSNVTMAAALARHDWATFARLYNGPGYDDAPGRQNDYDTRLAAAYGRVAHA